MARLLTYKTLKRLRVGVSVAFFAALTLCILDDAFAVTPIGRHIVASQLVPAILAGAAVWIVLWVLVTLSFGRIYCSTVCPLGTIQDVAGFCTRKIKKGKRFRYSPPINALRFPIPGAVALCLFLGFTYIVHMTDPYSIYIKIVYSIAKTGAISTGGIACAWIVLVLLNALASWRGRLYCNTVCPAGALLSFLGRAPLYRIDIDTDKCIHCGRCEDVCKSECIDLRNMVVDNSRCVVCLNCTAVCPNSAIILRKGRFRLSTPLMRPTMQCTKDPDLAGSKSPVQH